MANDRIDAYADALFGVAAAEGRLDDVEDELFRFARVFEGSDELRAALTDPQTPATRRQQIVEDLLQGKASPTTRVPTPQFPRLAQVSRFRFALELFC